MNIWIWLYDPKSCPVPDIGLLVEKQPKSLIWIQCCGADTGSFLEMLRYTSTGTGNYEKAGSRQLLGNSENVYIKLHFYTAENIPVLIFKT